jgi:hypothetical protein
MNAQVSSSSMDKDRINAERFVSALFRGVLRREPNPSGLRSLAAVILNGGSYTAVAEAFVNSEEFRSQAKLYVPPGHFYSPVVNPEEAERHLERIKGAVDIDHLPGIAIDRAAMVELWRRLLPYLQTIPFSNNRQPGFRYFFQNPTYAFGDGSILHAMIRNFRPKRLIEIGSGYSSACTLDTVERFLDGACEVTFIEPYPTLLRKVLDDKRDTRILEMPVQQVPLSVFEQLEAGDILFIDSTHVLRTGSDVCFELFEILPRLAPGVLVHFHDMFWPFEYPRVWVIDHNKSWNEIYAVRAFLTDNKSWNILFFNDYIFRFEREMIERTFPTFLRVPGGALWMVKI